MIIDANESVSITTFNQKLSNILKEVEEKKEMVILRRNKPAFVIMAFKEYERIKTVFLLNEADALMEEYDKAFKELAK